MPRHPVGDVAGRVNVRAMEVDVTLALLDELLAQRWSRPGYACSDR